MGVGEMRLPRVTGLVIKQVVGARWVPLAVICRLAAQSRSRPLHDLHDALARSSLITDSRIGKSIMENGLVSVCVWERESGLPYDGQLSECVHVGVLCRLSSLYNVISWRLKKNVIDVTYLVDFFAARRT